MKLIRENFADLNINLVRASLLACEAYRILGPSENAFIYFFQIRFSDSVMQIKKKLLEGAIFDVFSNRLSSNHLGA